MRCCVCDYSTTAGSEYNLGLSRSYAGNKMKFDRIQGGYLCSECESISMDTLNEMILPDEEVVFNSPTFRTSKTK